MSGGASSWSFREDDFRRIQAILSGFLGESNSRTALIVDRTGQLVATALDLPVSAVHESSGLPDGTDVRVTLGISSSR